MKYLFQKIEPYLLLMRLHRPIGILLLLWPTLIALWLAANGRPDFATMLIFVAGVVVMRSAGCVINDYADRNIDRHVARTKDRPLATGTITASQALGLFVLLVILAIGLVIQLKLSTIVLSSIGLILVIIYPFAKRFTFYPQFILGLAFAWGIPLVYMQLQNALPVETWILFTSIICWVVAYDTQYALADITDDLQIGVKSTAIAFGKYVAPIIFSLQILSLAGLSYVGWSKSLRWQFFAGLLVALAFAIYQQYLIKDGEPGACLKAFKNNNYFGAVIFLGLLLGIN